MNILEEREIIKASRYMRETTVAILVLTLVSVIFYGISASADPSAKPGYWEGSKDIYWSVDTPRKMIALTFDDGPNELYTPEILAILVAHDARATFFCVGKNVEKYPHMAWLIAVSGNEIGNHTYSHKTIRGMSEDRLREEIVKTHQAILNATGTEPTLFRPPLGWYDQQSVKVTSELGYRVILWSKDQDTQDWRKYSGERLAESVIENASNGDIVLMHDGGGNRSQTVKALPLIIEGLRSKGFQLVTVSELLANRL